MIYLNWTYKMTEQEYLCKKYNIATSEASLEIREKAMQKLEAEYNNNSIKIAQQQFTESQPDPIKGVD